MAGTLDLVQRGYMGAEIRDGVLYFAPRLTDQLDGLSFPMQFRGTPIRVTLGGRELTVTVHTEGFSRPIKVGVGDDVRELGAGAAGHLRPAADRQEEQACQTGFAARSSTSTACSSTRRTSRPGATRCRSSWRTSGATSATRRRWTPGAVHAAGLPAGHVRQAAHGRRHARRSSTSRSRTPRSAWRPTPTASRTWSSSSSRRASSAPTPTRCASCSPSRARGSRSRRRRRRRTPGSSCARSASTSSPRTRGWSTTSSRRG